MWRRAAVVALGLALCAVSWQVAGDRRGAYVPPAIPTPDWWPTANPATVSVVATDRRALGRLRLTPAHRREIADVLAASSAADRARLIVSLPDGNDADGLTLFYGDPRFPNGLIPNDVLGNAPAEIDGKTVRTGVAYRAIGAACNVLYRPAEGYRFAATEASCTDFHERAADRVVARFDASGAVAP